MSNQAHWNTVYQTKQPNEVSWFAPHLSRSLNTILESVPDRSAAIIDVGAGECTLVDDLLEHGYRDISLLDISEAALQVTRNRLGERGVGVHWYAGDILSTALAEHRFDVWHDRAVFHFLLEPSQRAAYVAQAHRAIKPGGLLIIRTFAEDGPQKCSGLPVCRYGSESLQREFSGGFFLLESSLEDHFTPSGTVQKFVFCHFRRQ